jgi:peroxiredoxin Q/BCP
MSCSNNNGEKGPLVVGSQAPIFEAKDSDGNVWKSSDYIGKKILVVYFYPVAMTGG